MTVPFHKPSHGPPGDEKQFLEDCFDDIRREKGIRVEYRIPAWEAWRSELQSWPHPTQTHVIYVPGTWLPELAGKGLLTNLSERLPQLVQGWEGRYSSRVFEMGRVNGKQYGIPVYGAVWCFMYNTRLLEAAGITEPPSTWNELLSCAKQVKTVFPDIVPYGINDDSDGHFVDHGLVYLLAGGLADFAEGCGSLHFDNEWSVKGLSFLRHLVQEGLANPPADAPSHRIMELFLAERLAMTVGPSDWVLQQRSRFPAFPLRVAMMPCPPGGAQLSFASYGFYCIVAGGDGLSGAAALLGELVEPQRLERHIRTVGMLPLQTGMSLYGQDSALSVFARQVSYSGSFPAAEFDYADALTREMIACLNLAKSPEAALRNVTEMIPKLREEANRGKFGEADMSRG